MRDERLEPDAQEIERQAADWIVRLSDPALSADARAILRERRDRWLAASPEHRASYGEIDRAWYLLREAALAAGTLGKAEAEPPQARPAPAAAPLRRRAARGGRAWPIAAALILGLALGLARLYGGDPLLAFEADHLTAPGEIREIALADGSRVLLGSDSAIALSTEEGSRRIRLLAGDAAFVVAPRTSASGKAPFVVEAEGVEARALGTRFQVRRTGGGGTEVTVSEHLVRVSRQEQPGEAPVVLGPGERLTVLPGPATGLLESVDLERATAWQQGRLVFDRRPLSEVVAELNRHRRGRIVVADPTLAGREVSGVFRLDELDRAVERIARELGASRIELPLVSLLY